MLGGVVFLVQDYQSETEIKSRAVGSNASVNHIICPHVMLDGVSPNPSAAPTTFPPPPSASNHAEGKPHPKALTLSEELVPHLYGNRILSSQC